MISCCVAPAEKKAACSMAKPMPGQGTPSRVNGTQFKPPPPILTDPSSSSSSKFSEQSPLVAHSGELKHLKLPPSGELSRAPSRAPSVSVEVNEMIEGRSSAANPNVAGVLHKWVNFGKRWRSRWFVLHDGVLSYYKVHGPDKLYVNQELQKGVRVIGDEAQKLMRKPRKHWNEKRPRKTSGDVHLMVASIRKSKSDDKKFYIFTGTNSLHLRAESRDDRATWLEALQAGKDLLPKIICLQPHEEDSISTDGLRKRLIEAGVSQGVIKDCENIILTEFREKVTPLQQRYLFLMNRLNQLEAEKVELETTVVEESRSHEDQPQERDHGSESDSEEDNGKMLDAETDDDDDLYFDTAESLSGSFRSPSFLHRQLSADPLDGEDSPVLSTPRAVLPDPAMELFSQDYPIVNRRKKLPDPKEKEKGFSLWSIIKDNIGKDLTKVCLPVYFNEPISSLQKCFEDLEYSYLLDRAAVCGQMGNSLLRILYVAAFAVSGYASTDGRICKPFNPLLGETYEADYPDKGVKFFSEKVSHHPMVVACHCEGRGWKLWGDSNLKSKFWGRSIQLDPVGILTLEFDDGEVFQWSKVTTSIYNLILGKLYCDHYGTMRIQGNRDMSCKLKFKELSIIDRNPHQIHGFVYNKANKKLATLFGKWDGSMYYVNGDLATKPRGYDPMCEAELLWARNLPSDYPTRYNLSSFAITVNELTPGLEEKLPPTDSRLRPDQRHLENGEYEQANSEKLRLEGKQRRARKLQERGWQPRWFHKDIGSSTFKYIGGYWEARSQGDWSNCPDIFGQSLPDDGSD
ncbi:oxysterol-binding protein-related protein 1A isoform X1 [Selaginella moellendorffii]|uniref:oxysterol-binding protein-related protein 1A isoform X1 n=1 Tax=Selaginella moellendorffii TaxID=88036 RepID=UPI000D1CA458|nr:oxysterol-binding protein-related protein 1A isoform X1 [Selaginella moellendorffii]|eukprot:XP_024520129.1 oxysterol-binding protein-related protein 1A isoform X1 [Selaginella moellendorffii]